MYCEYSGTNGRFFNVNDEKWQNRVAVIWFGFLSLLWSAGSGLLKRPLSRHSDFSSDSVTLGTYFLFRYKHWPCRCAQLTNRNTDALCLGNVRITNTTSEQTETKASLAHTPFTACDCFLQYLFITHMGSMTSHPFFFFFFFFYGLSLGTFCWTRRKAAGIFTSMSAMGVRGFA